jgi:hypothetical protein
MSYADQALVGTLLSDAAGRLVAPIILSGEDTVVVSSSRSWRWRVPQRRAG